MHSNGFSLVRKALIEGKGRKIYKAYSDELGRTLAEELLEPTRIYVQPLLSLFGRYRVKRPIKALAHITGGGLVENIPRVLPKGCGVRLRRSSWEVPPIFDILAREGNIAQKEMDRVFNNGLGMILIAARTHCDAIVAHLKSEDVDARVVGEVVPGSGVSFQRA